MSKLKDLTGQTFGFLTVISRAENRITPSGQSKTTWNCKCKCGKEVKVLVSNLLRGNSTSCGCEHINHLSEINTVDLTGQRFGKLLVLRKDDRKGKNSYWICRCDCGKEKAVCATALKHGQKSCGCSAYDNAKKTIGNSYAVDENNVVHVILRSGEEMICDIEDWEGLEKFTWTNDKHGYAVSNIDGKIKKFHVLIKGKRKGLVIDHINRNKLDNRKENLRFLTKSGNAINSKLSTNNTSGVKGVIKLKNGKWHAQLMINGECVHLGTFETIEEAGKARKRGEEKYHLPVLNAGY